MGRKIGLGRIWSFVLGFRSLVARLVPFERGGTKPEGEKIFGNGKCELIANFSATMVTSPRRERREVWREKRKVRFFGKGKCKLIACKFIANFSATMVTSLPSLSVSLSLSLSHRKYLTHNIGSASALPIIKKLKKFLTTPWRHPYKILISQRYWNPHHNHKGQSPSVIANHNLLGGCDSQSHLDSDPEPSIAKPVGHS